jgi:Zn-dependent metalloprotease
MAKMKSVSASYERSPKYKVPQRIYNIDEAAGKGGSRKIAEAFLKKVSKELGIKPDLSQLKFDKIKTTVLGKHVLFQQYEAGKPISGAWVRVDIDKSGKIFNVLTDLVPEKLFKKRKAAALPEKNAVEIAFQATDSVKKSRKARLVDTEQVFYAGEKSPVEAWKIVLRASKPTAEWKVYVDAETGEVLEKISLLKQATGSGFVFDPNPVVTLNDTGLTDSSSISDSAYFEVALHDLKNSGMLDGPYVTTKSTSDRVKKADRKFHFKRGQRGFTEVMAFYHIDRTQRYIQELGFDNVNNRHIPVNARGGPEDNSFYSPVTKSLSFGLGGVDDAEDAEIILHEYGHAIQDDQVPGFGESHECGSMGEGFGDYLAGSVFADLKTESLRPCVGSWDAVAYSGDEPPNLRRLDSNKKYPKDMVHEVHGDGEIWSSCLWQIRAKLGRRAADKVIIAHHFLIKRTATFEDAANALIQADENLNGGANAKEIREVFVARGILKNPKRKNKRAGESMPYARRQA